MQKSIIIPVILCGGVGTRLWPLSRKSFPKQFLSVSDSKNSLLQNTQIRLKNLNGLYDPILVCNEEHRFIVAEQMRSININPHTILLEPFGRNTAPAITLAALEAININKKIDPIILVLSSDHEIRDEINFIKVINKGIKYAMNDKLVTFGIVPTSPKTEYGYIKAENPFIEEKIEAENIIEFTEKPNIETAKKFIQDKRFTWNSGIFMFKANTLLNEINKFSPEIVEICRNSLKKSKIDLDFKRLDINCFQKCPDLSIDICVMEKTNKGMVLPLNAKWSDVGSWQALWENSDKDKNGNFIRGKVISESSKNCYLKSESRLLVGIGLKDLIAVETNDAILISERSQTQKVKEIVQQLKEKKLTEGEMHTKIFRPWGHYISIAEESRWQVKMIHVNPSAQLSLQMHHHRSEHWVVVNGRAKVEIDKEISFLSENESIYIPLGAKHRLTNPGKIPLTIIEIQSGSYVGEDDIVRFEDAYGRIN
tara:strand:- start:30821 stop:32263 length:1443 start_codon:yes stop_codon:yes gene_type:complete